MSLRGYKLVVLAVAARIGASGNVASVDLRDYDGEGRVQLNASATEGGGMTYNGKLQHSDDNATFVDVTGGAFTQVTNAAALAQVKSVNVSELKRYVRVVDTLAGGSPFVTRGVTLLAKKNPG